MDCNREDASQAKEIAITKFNDKDFLNAKKFAEKAQQLYPQLEGISGLLQNIELHISAEKQIGEINWYKDLDVSSKTNVEIINKQSKKEALAHHPDKNREVGSENPFKLVNEAFNILKDGQTRAEYDERVILNTISKPEMKMGFEPKITTNSEFVLDIATPTHATLPIKEFNFFPTSSESSSNGDRTNDDRTNDDQTRLEYFNYIFDTKNVNIPSCLPPPPTYANALSYQSFSEPKMMIDSKKLSPLTTQVCNDSTSKDGSSKKRSVKTDLKKLKKDLFQIRSSTASCRGEHTFWTECSGCKSKFEYMMIYMKQFINCVVCKEAFQAFEIEVPLCYSNEVKPLVASGTDSDGTTHYTFMTTEPVSQQRKAKGEGNMRSKKPKKSLENAAGVPLNEELMRKKMAQEDMNEGFGQQRFGGGVRIKEEPVIEEVEGQIYDGEVKEEPASDNEIPFIQFF